MTNKGMLVYVCNNIQTSVKDIDLQHNLVKTEESSIAYDKLVLLWATNYIFVK